jgi:hypothetical protein
VVVNLGLSNCESQNALVAAFARPHSIRRTVRILDLNHNLIKDVSNTFLEGQVNIDQYGDPVTRSATVSLFDPKHEIGFDQDNPAKGVVSPKYLLQLHRGIYVNPYVGWVDIPVGVLLITKPTRSGDILTLEAQGKEKMARRKPAKQLLLPASMLKTTAITTIMHTIGETRFRLEPSKSVLGKPFVVDLETTPWAACYKIAKSMNRQLFYDAEGYVLLRTKPRSPVFTFRYGNYGTVLSDPDFSYTDGEFYNEVHATGGTPKGKNAPIIKVARVDKSHPLYTTRDGIFMPSIYEVTNDKLTTPEQVQELADDTLAQVILDSQTASWESLPVWHLDQGDPVRLTDALDDHGNGASYSETVTIRTMSIPLTLGTQSNGHLRRVSRSKTKIRKAA